jgi:hypothetical protein
VRPRPSHLPMLALRHTVQFQPLRDAQTAFSRRLRHQRLLVSAVWTSPRHPRSERPLQRSRARRSRRRLRLQGQRLPVYRLPLPQQPHRPAPQPKRPQLTQHRSPCRSPQGRVRQASMQPAGLRRCWQLRQLQLPPVRRLPLCRQRPGLLPPPQPPSLRLLQQPHLRAPALAAVECRIFLTCSSPQPSRAAAAMAAEARLHAVPPPLLPRRQEAASA